MEPGDELKWIKWSADYWANGFGNCWRGGDATEEIMAALTGWEYAAEEYQRWVFELTGRVAPFMSPEHGPQGGR